MKFEDMLRTVNEEVKTPEEIYIEMKEEIKMTPECNISYWKGRIDSWDNIVNLLDMFKRGIESIPDEWTEYEEGIYRANEEFSCLLSKLSQAHRKALNRLIENMKDR